MTGPCNHPIQFPGPCTDTTCFCTATTELWVDCPILWGVPFLIGFAVLAALYLSGGIFLGVRAGRRDRRGSVAQLGWLDPSNGLGAVRAHPHYPHWQRFYGLVRDGVVITMSANTREVAITGTYQRCFLLLYASPEQCVAMQVTGEVDHRRRRPMSHRQRAGVASETGTANNRIPTARRKRGSSMQKRKWIRAAAAAKAAADPSRTLKTTRGWLKGLLRRRVLLLQIAT